MTENARETAPTWQLDVALDILKRWFEIGDASYIEYYAGLRRRLFENSPSQHHRDEFAAITQDIELIKSFERQNGEGSFLNLDHRVLQKSVSGDSNAYNGTKIAAAKAARCRRKALYLSLSITRRSFPA